MKLIHRSMAGILGHLLILMMTGLCPVVSTAMEPTSARGRNTNYQLLRPVHLESEAVFTTARPYQVNDLAIVQDDYLIMAEGSFAEPGLLCVVDLKNRWRISRFDTRLGMISLAPLTTNVASSSWDSTVRIHEIPSLKPLHRILIDRSATRIAASPDAKSLAIVAEGHEDRDDSKGRFVSVANVVTGTVARTLTRDVFRGFQTAYSPDGNEIAIAGGLFGNSSGGILAWNAISGDKTIDIQTTSPLWKLCYTRDGDWLIGTGTSGTVVVDRKSGKLHQSSPQRGHTLLILPGDKSVLIGVGEKLHLMSIPDLELQKTVASEQGSVRAISLLHDGRHLVTTSSLSSRVWNLSDWTSEHLVTGRVAVSIGTSLVHLPQSALMAIASGSELRLIEHSGSLWNSKVMPSAIRRITSNESADRLGIILENGVVMSVDVKNGTRSILGEIPAKSLSVLSHDLASYFTVTADGDLQVRSFPDSAITRFQRLPEKGSVLAASRTGAVGCGMQSGHVIVYSSDLEKTLVNLPNAAGGAVRALQWLETSRQLAVGDDAGISVWQFSPEGQAKLVRHTPMPVPVASLQFSPNADLVAVGLSNGAISLVPTLTSDPAQQMAPRSVRPVTTCQWVQDDELITCSADGLMGRHKLKPRPIEPAREMQAPDNVTMRSACIDAEGETCFLAVGPRIEVRSVKSWNTEQVLEGHRGTIMRVRVSPDDKTLASTGDDTVVQLWQKTNGKWETEQTLFLPSQGHRLEWSPDGRWLLVGVTEREVLVFDTASWKLAQTLSVPFIPNTFGFSGDGRRVACAGINVGDPAEKCQIQVYDTMTWKDPTTFAGHRHGIEAIGMTYDGKRFFSTAADAGLLEWSLETGLLRKVCDLPKSGTSLTLLPDERHAIVSWHFANLGIVDLTSGILLPMGAHTVGENVLMRDLFVTNRGEWAVSIGAANLGQGTGSAKLWQIGKTSGKPRN